MPPTRVPTPTPATPPRSGPGSTGAGLRRGFPAFRYPNYRLYFVGQFVSVTGTWIQTLALSWLVVDGLNGSAVQLGLVSVCQFAPVLLFGLPAGVVADRVPRRNLLTTTAMLSGILAAALAVLVATDTVQLWHVYLLALGLGVVNAFDMPARQAFVSEMVGKADLMNAVALNSALFNAGRVVGPGIAGLLLATYGSALCFGLNAASYLAVVAAMLLMRLAPVERAGDGQALEHLKEGLTYVRSTPAVLLPIVLVGCVATFGMNFNVWIPVLAKEDFGSGARGFGLLMSSMGIGSLLGALGLAYFGRQPRRRLMIGTALGLGVLEGALALAGAMSTPLLVAIPVLAGIGFTVSTTMALANTTVQTTAPDALRGRVMSVYMTVFAGTAPFGSLVAGATANLGGAPLSVAVGGTVTLLAALAIGARGRLLEQGAQIQSHPEPTSLPGSLPPRPIRRSATTAPRLSGDE
ncbi:MAG: MFS transporter [Chloroflexota bacterium]|nr:MFS transporter [Chloroflexota bacterium]